MSEYIDRLALALFLSEYPDGQDCWPDRLDEHVSGPPFNADGYRDMVRAVLRAMEQPSQKMLDLDVIENDLDGTGAGIAKEIWKGMIEAALKDDSD